MYVHRRCAPAGAELDEEKKAGGFCASCGQEGTIFHVVGTIDFYQHILNGVLYNVTDGVQSTPMEPVWQAERIKSAKVKAARAGVNYTAPVEEVAESIAEAVEEATEVEEQREESPEETAPAEAVEPTEEEVVAESPEVKEEAVEAESEPSVDNAAAEAKRAEIAFLEAELEALKK